MTETENTAIKIENVSKLYRLGLVGTGSFSSDLSRWWAMHVLGKEDPFLKIGETNIRSSKAMSDYVWALKDINLEIPKGAVLGIIGKNGAGKSTLLKLLSRVTKPTSGTISYKGKIASLLEVGTGFHPELTGRENIYMNGTIMGMTRADIDKKLDEIISFAGIERYIDTPVKRYSSGMTVRLGFSVAAHLEPDILVVDEVLAVGDAEFQKKAIGKMKDVSAGSGRTVLFVSHNMTAIRNLCPQSLLMENGSIAAIGPSEDVINRYLSAEQNGLSKKATWTADNYPFERPDIITLDALSVSTENKEVHEAFSIEDEIDITLKFTVIQSQYINFSFRVCMMDGVCILDVLSPGQIYEKGTHTCQLKLPRYFLNENMYSIGMVVTLNQVLPSIIYREHGLLNFQVFDAEERPVNYYGKWNSILSRNYLNDRFKMEKI